MKPMELRIFTDGGSRGNPGPAACGIAVYRMEGDEEIEMERKGLYLGETTNNQAEYQGAILALKTALEIGAAYVEVVMDSELAVKQLKGEYKVKNAGLAERFLEMRNLQTKFTNVTFRHVRREFNTVADAEVNKVLDARM